MDWFGFHKPRWKELEKSLINHRAQRKQVWLNTTCSRVYYLTNIDQPNTTYTETCISLHGTASTSLIFLDLVKHLPNHTRFFFVDLPGFGKSHTLTSTSQYTTEQYLDFFATCLLEFINHFHLEHVRLIGHSFGSFIGGYFAHKHPERIQTIVLISPAGLFPTLDYCGWYYAVLFKLRFPYFLKWVRLILRMLFRILKYKTYFFYWLICYSDRKTFAGKVISSCITMTWKGAYWNYPILDKLIAIPKPITLIYGEHDNLIPSHQGPLAQGINPNIQVEVVPDTFHNPISSVPEQIITYCFRNEPEIEFPRERLVSEIGICIRNPEKYQASFLFSSTRKNIQLCYQDILSTIRNVFKTQSSNKINRHKR